MDITITIGFSSINFSNNRFGVMENGSEGESGEPCVELFAFEKSPEILAHSKLNTSISSSDFSIPVCLHLHRKDSNIHRRGLGVYAREPIQLDRELSFISPGHSCMRFRLALRESVSYPSSNSCRVQYNHLR